MSIGIINRPLLFDLVPNLQPFPAFIDRLEQQVRIANLNPHHVTTWMKAGVFPIPVFTGTAPTFNDLWCAAINQYVTMARMFTAASGGDEEYASYVAAAGYTVTDAQSWPAGKRPPVDELKTMMALRKFGVCEMDPDSVPPPPKRPEKQQQGPDDETVARALRGV